MNEPKHSKIYQRHYHKYAILNLSAFHVLFCLHINAQLTVGILSWLMRKIKHLWLHGKWWSWDLGLRILTPETVDMTAEHPPFSANSVLVYFTNSRQLKYPVLECSSVLGLWDFVKHLIF